MGMLDEFNLSGNKLCLPYCNHRAIGYYQGKDLSCNLHTFTFDKENRIQLFKEAIQMFGKLEDDLAYTGPLEIYMDLNPNSLGIRWVEFILTIKDGMVMGWEKISPYDESIEVIQEAMFESIPNKILVNHYRGID